MCLIYYGLLKMSKDMQDWLRENLVCPRDHSKLKESEGDFLSCPLGHRYPIVEGIPVMLLEEKNPTQPEVFKATLDRRDRQEDTGPSLGNNAIEPYVQEVIAATCGRMYKSLVNKLSFYPIPSLPLPKAKGGYFLDIGCNWGRWSIAASRSGYQAIGIDHNLEALLAGKRVARQLGVDIIFLAVDARYLPFAGAAFDLVFSYSVLQHFSKQDVRLCLTEFSRVLKAWGSSLIQMPNAFGLHNLFNQTKIYFMQDDNFRVRYWRPKELLDNFKRLIGPTLLSVDGFFSLNSQGLSKQALPLRYRLLLNYSGILRRLSMKMSQLKYLADSLYVISTKEKPKPPDMRVTISVCGKFHAFHLASQLERRGYLKGLFTTYPRFKLKGLSLPHRKCTSLPLKIILDRFCPKICYYTNNLFDKQVSRRIEPCDLFVGWSGSALNSLKKAKAQGAVTVLERGSSHIEYQRDILNEEYAQLGIAWPGLNSRIVERELEEYAQADYISLPSSFARQTFLEKGIPEARLIQAPYGVDTQLFRPSPKKDKLFRVIYAGSITVRKGLHYLLEAVSSLKLKNFELWLMGSVWEDTKPFLKKYNGCFRYLGHIRQERLFEYYSQGTVFVLPSLQEGLALVILEAMACGLPVICTANTGAADIVREGLEGFIIPIRDTEALKEKILYLYENPDLCQEMGRQALKRVTENFSWDNYADNIVEAYQKLLKMREA